MDIRETRNKSGSSAADGLLWFAAGLAAGSAIGILFAPQPGEETRRKLRDLADEGRNTLADRSRVLVDQGREFFEKGRDLADEAAELFERGRNLVDS